MADFDYNVNEQTLLTPKIWEHFLYQICLILAKYVHQTLDKSVILCYITILINGDCPVAQGPSNFLSAVIIG